MGVVSSGRGPNRGVQGGDPLRSVPITLPTKVCFNISASYMSFCKVLEYDIRLVKLYYKWVK
jgi:hypothetical protein